MNLSKNKKPPAQYCSGGFNRLSFFRNLKIVNSGNVKTD